MAGLKKRMAPFSGQFIENEALYQGDLPLTTSKAAPATTPTAKL